MTERITTNRYGDQLYVFLPPDMKTVTLWPDKYKYQWHAGKNPHTTCLLTNWSAEAAPLYWAIYLNLSSSLENLHLWKLCWVSVPHEYVIKSEVSIGCFRLFIDRIRTVEELRQCDDPLYRQIMAFIAFLCNPGTRFSKHFTEFDQMLELQGRLYYRRQVHVPEEYTHSVDWYTLLAIVCPQHIHLVTLQDKELAQTITNRYAHSSYLHTQHILRSLSISDFLNNDRRSNNVMEKIYDPDPIKAKRNLLQELDHRYQERLNWVVN